MFGFFTRLFAKAYVAIEETFTEVRRINESQRDALAIQERVNHFIAIQERIDQMNDTRLNETRLDQVPAHSSQRRRRSRRQRAAQPLQRQVRQRIEPQRNPRNNHYRGRRQNRPRIGGRHNRSNRLYHEHEATRSSFEGEQLVQLGDHIRRGAARHGPRIPGHVSAPRSTATRATAHHAAIPPHGSPTRALHHDDRMHVHATLTPDGHRPSDEPNAWQTDHHRVSA